MDLSIIILNFKTRGLTKQCLKNLYTKNFTCTFEIIVVDNNSHDGAIKEIRELFPDVKTVALKRNTGFAGGNNSGMKEAGGDYIFILNPDVAALPEEIEKLFFFMKQCLRIGIAAPRLNNPNGSLQYSCLRWPMWYSPFLRRTFLGKITWGNKKLAFYLMKDFDHKDARPVPWVLGACVMVQAHALKKVGLLDERFFLYMEDVDWCRRFWEHGFQVYYFPQATMIHYHQRLSAERGGLKDILNKNLYHHIISWIKYYVKYFGKKEPAVSE